MYECMNVHIHECNVVDTRTHELEHHLCRTLIEVTIPEDNAHDVPLQSLSSMGIFLILMPGSLSAQKL